MGRVKLVLYECEACGYEFHGPTDLIESVGVTCPSCNENLLLESSDEDVRTLKDIMADMPGVKVDRFESSGSYIIGPVSKRDADECVRMKIKGMFVGLSAVGGGYSIILTPHGVQELIKSAG